MNAKTNDNLKCEDFKNQINEFIEKNEKNIILDLQQLIKIPSVKSEKENNAPFGKNSAEVLIKACEIAKNCGLKTNNLENYIGYGDLIGEDSTPYLGILTHLDIVPEGSGWIKNPFSGEVENGLVFGRGAIDDKGPTISVIYALKAINSLKIPLKKTVRLIMGCDEETGSGDDIEKYKQNEKMPPLVFTPDADFPVINGEKGMLKVFFEENSFKDVIYIKGGEVINAVASLCVAKVMNTDVKTVYEIAKLLNLDEFIEAENDDNTVKITVRGVNSHASTPQEGINANTIMFKLLANLKISESSTFKKLSSAFEFGDNFGESLGISSSDEISGKLTSVLSMLSLENELLEGKIDIRFPVTKTKVEICNLIEKAFKNKRIHLLKISGTEPHYTNEKSEFVQTLLKTYSLHTSKDAYCISIGGGTYVHDIDGGVAFGVAVKGENNHMHGADEFISIEALKDNAKLFAKAIINICG
ncbi:MAG: Sapep family Mn(2+)-dependent dipeptidase [Oscillospiraceae bacterium]